MDRSAFFKHLRRTHLLSQQQPQGSGEQHSDGEQARTLADGLVTQGLLTHVQARQLLADDAQGLLLGSYRLVERIGPPSTSRVIKAVSTVNSRVVALKILVPEGFPKDVQTALRLDHPHIVTTYDACEIEGVPVLVLEYLDGSSLDELVKQYGPLPVGLACDLVCQAAEALHHAHGKGIIHGGIKPANLVISAADGSGFFDHSHGTLSSADLNTQLRLKVSDFGLAQWRRREPKKSDPSAAEKDALLEAADYLAPEQSQAGNPADSRSDLYSLGCTFYFALTGRPPFTGKTVLEKFRKHLLNKPEPLEKYCPDVPAEVSAIVQRLLDKDPNQRYQAAAELLQELLPWRGPALPETPPDEPPARATPETATTRPADSVPSPAVNGLLPETSAGGELVPPGGPGTAAVDPVLRRSFRDWTAIVRLFAQGKGARQRVNPRAYQVLYDRLLDACRSQAGEADAASWRFFWKLGEMVRPWMTMESLAGANREVLYDLLNNCQQVEEQLGFRQRRLSLARWNRPLVWLILILLLTGVGWCVNQFVYPFASQLNVWIVAVWFLLNRVLDIQWWVVGGAILAFILMFIVSRSART